MRDITHRLLRTLLAAFLFAISNFITAGFGACGVNFIEYHGKPPEMLGWSGCFLLMGCLCLVLSTGGLLVQAVYAFVCNVAQKMVYLFSAIHGTLLGFLFLLCAYIMDILIEEVLSDFSVSLICIAVWVLFAVVSFFCCIYFKSKTRGVMG